MLPRCLSRVLVCLAVGMALLVGRPAEAAKNVIILVADGSGFNAWLATSMHQGKCGKQVYDGPDWVKLGCSTHPLNMSHKPTGKCEQDASLVYDKARYWDATAEEIKGGGTGAFRGYNYAKGHFTDSAAAATALVAGVKTFNNAINWTDDDKPLSGKTIPEIAHARGKSCGVVTSVEWSHATPAGLGGAHNISRDKFAAIANEMLDGGWLDVIVGAGHPDFDDDAKPRSIDPQRRNYEWVGGRETWAKLTAGQHPAGWKLVQTKAEFEALTHGPTPAKVVGTVQVATTLQQKRRGAFNQGVPSLATIAKAAINCLDDNPKGFYLMIEGGAVDWANHANEAERMIEEQADYLAAVEAVCQWVEKHSNWNETLVILTADHETGMIWGPRSDVEAFQSIEDRGAGKLPGLMFHAKNHSLSLVPFHARGAGAERAAALVRGTDEKAAKAWNFSGQYIDNTDVFTLMREAVEKP